MKLLGTCQAVFFQMKQGFLIKIWLKKPVLPLYVLDRFLWSFWEISPVGVFIDLGS
jgi:hypothetical protein